MSLIEPPGPRHLSPTTSTAASVRSLRTESFLLARYLGRKLDQIYRSALMGQQLVIGGQRHPEVDIEVPGVASVPYFVLRCRESANVWEITSRREGVVSLTGQEGKRTLRPGEWTVVQPINFIELTRDQSSRSSVGFLFNLLSPRDARAVLTGNLSAAMASGPAFAQAHGWALHDTVNPVDYLPFPDDRSRSQRVLIGTADNMHWRLSLYRGASPLHAEMFFDRNLFWVRDLGSNGGTWVNGTRLSKNAWCLLRNNDELRFGSGGVVVIIDDVSCSKTERDGVAYYLVKDPLAILDGTNVPGRSGERAVICVREDDLYFQEYLSKASQIFSQQGGTQEQRVRALSDYTRRLFSETERDEKTITGWLGGYDTINKVYPGKKFSVGYNVKGKSGYCIHRAILLACALQRLGFDARMVRGWYEGTPHAWVEVEINGILHVADPGIGQFMLLTKAYCEDYYIKDTRDNVVEVPVLATQSRVGSHGTIYLPYFFIRQLCFFRWFFG